jgi:hypothetical protein
MLKPKKEVDVNWTVAVAGLIPMGGASASAEKLDVKIIDRQEQRR